MEWNKLQDARLAVIAKLATLAPAGYLGAYGTDEVLLPPPDGQACASGVPIYSVFLRSV